MFFFNLSQTNMKKQKTHLMKLVQQSLPLNHERHIFTSPNIQHV